MLLLPSTPVRPDSDVALTDSGSGRRWSRAELESAVASLAAGLKGARKRLVFLLCRNDARTVLAYLASIEAGHAVALLDSALSIEFQDRLIALYEPDLLISSGRPLDGYDFALESDIQIGRRQVASEAEVHPDLALMLSTSGSTGTPKFVRLTRRNIESNAHSIREALAIGADDRPITSLPIHYSYGLSVINSHLAAGAEIVLTHQAAIAPAFWDAFRTYGCTSFSGVPYSYQILRRLDFDKLNIPTLNTLTQAGGRLHTDLVSHFHKIITVRGGRMFVMYGQTEATARIAISPAGRLNEKLGSAGLAIPGGTLSILTPDGETTDPGVTGEVIYSGPNVMMGYAQTRADLALGDTLGQRLHTGDAGYLDSEGFLYLTGRKKRDAKVFGLRLNMDEIEDMMRRHGPTAVVSSGEKLIFFCEHGDLQQFSEYSRELSGKLKLHPSSFEFRRIDELPLNANGKVDYTRLEGSL
ncbi:MAG TPA: AMP-binding protein [Bryobacteraceae bacterium]|jgi:acyl-CoA synthetase (AMP-forming)/AMP-acid ligase II